MCVILIHSIAVLVFPNPRIHIVSTANKLTGIHFILGVCKKCLGAGSLCQVWHQFFGFELFVFLYSLVFSTMEFGLQKKSSRGSQK